ncbi:MAG: hypothetical protein JNM21_05075 [Taibaiella sp.]|nr:hypothetical protein [Taibaiella sp.]
MDKFLHIKLNTYIEVFKDSITFIDTKGGAELYMLKDLAKRKLFGYAIYSIKLYFHQYLVSVSYSFEASLDEYPDLMDCISLALRQKPQIIVEQGISFFKWDNQLEALYCFPDFENNKILLYHTLKEYDIIV